MEDEITQLELDYGVDGYFEGELLACRLIAHQQSPERLPSVAEATRRALWDPVDFPNLEKAFVPEDRVTIVLEAHLPQADEVILTLCEFLEQADVAPGDITIVRPVSLEQSQHDDPCRLLDDEWREHVQLKLHDPTDEAQCAYLANTADGERIYLSNEVTEADIVIAVGTVQFDSLLGYRGGASCLFPGLSNVETIRRAMGQGHDELTPSDARPLRQMVDEVTWLLGLQVAINVIPGSHGGIQKIVTGQYDRVFEHCKQSLQTDWRMRIPERAELVIATLTANEQGHTWAQIAQGIDTARRLVERGGRIVILTDMTASLTEGCTTLRNSRTPSEAIKISRERHPTEANTVIQIARAVDWANVYLLSQLEDNVVEDLFMIPLKSTADVRKLLSNDDSTVVIENADLVYADC